MKSRQEQKFQLGHDFFEARFVLSTLRGGLDELRVRRLQDVSDLRTPPPSTKVLVCSKGYVVGTDSMVIVTQMDPFLC